MKNLELDIDTAWLECVESKQKKQGKREIDRMKRERAQECVYGDGRKSKRHSY